MATPGISGFSHPCQPIDPCTDSTGSAGFVGFWLRLGYIIRVPPPPPRSLSHGWAGIVRPWMVLPAWAARQPPPQTSISRHWGFFTGEARLLNAGALWAGAIARWSNSAARIRLQPWSNISASLIQVGSTLRSSLWSMLSLEPFVIGICAAGAWDRGRQNTAPPSLGSAPLGSVQG
jgi:hypothetical protein